jgi:hypothetical protein
MVDLSIAMLVYQRVLMVYGFFGRLRLQSSLYSVDQMRRMAAAPARGPWPRRWTSGTAWWIQLVLWCFQFPIYIYTVYKYIYMIIYICVHNMYFRLWSWIDFLYISEGSLKADKFASASASLPCQLRQKMTWITRIQNVSFNGEKWIDDMDRNGTEMGYHLSISWVYPTIKIHWNG